jgi:hypothetical protein
VLGFTFEWPETGGAIKDAFAGVMVAEREVERDLLERARMLGVEPEEISVEDAAERVAAGARRCAAVALGPDGEALPAVVLLLRAAGRPDADELLEPLVGLPALADSVREEIEDDERELDEEALRAEIDRLDAALDAWCAGNGFDDEWHDLVTYGGHTMADFRAWYADGDVIGWDAVELREYLLDFVPRKVGIEDEHVERFPEAVAEVFRFLGATDRLEAEAAEECAKAALAAADRFVERARDPRNFGLAKAMTTAMLADGVDLSEQAAIDGWIASYNALPEEERHQRVPAFALPGFFSPPAPTRRPTATKRKPAAKARKTQRQARRRNRRS